MIDSIIEFCAHPSIKVLIPPEGAAMLKEIPLFACLDDDVLQKLQKAAVKRHYPKNTILFSKGDLSDSIYVIAEGRVKAVIYNEEGREMLLSLFGPGEYFGEMAMLDGQPRSASMVTKTPCRLLIIGQDDFKRALFGNPEMSLRLLNRVLGKLREATDRIENLTFLNVYGRMVNLFLQLARSQDNELAVTEKLTHQEIANMVGSSREMVSRIMKELVCGGYIAVDKKRIIIKKKLPMDF
jgi:CRP/FNR family cyclic AMP-dependent transcriptional regulator